MIYLKATFFMFDYFLPTLSEQNFITGIYGDAVTIQNGRNEVQWSIAIRRSRINDLSDRFLEYTLDGSSNSANQNRRKSGVYGRELEGSYSTIVLLFRYVLQQ